MAKKLRGFGIAAEVAVVPDTPHPFWLLDPWFDRAVADGFLRAQNRDMALVDTDIERLLARMTDYRAEPVTKWLTRAQTT